MLVLSRKVGQWISVGGNLVRVQVVEVRGNKVRLGIEAPKELRVFRQEVQDQIDRESKSA